MKNKNIGSLFILTGLISLLLGLLLGVIGSLQYIFQEATLNQYFPFYKTRPMHVTFVLSWIVLTAAGGIYHYLPQVSGRELFSKPLAKIHFILFIICGIGIIVCYFLGIFGGREYLEFPYYFIFPILLGWLFFAINFFKTIWGSKFKVQSSVSELRTPNFELSTSNFKIKTMPVYIWMWATGSIFMIWTLAEAYVWLIPYVRNNFIRDITAQWKSYGAFIGAWNMLIYGTASYLMCRISNDDTPAKSRLAFALYFIGFTNMLFNWGHHTYIVPAAAWIKHVSYIISMVELLILAKIIWDWKNTLTTAQKFSSLLPYRFLLASEFWIFLNLILALLISVPAINLFTHGTHITVAHAMGATIGINTMILFASVLFIAQQHNSPFILRKTKTIMLAFWLTQVSFLVFWLSLIGAGILKSYLSFSTPMLFREIMTALSPFFITMFCAGFILFGGLTMLIMPLIRAIKA